MEFEPHSQMFDLINIGIELDLILGDDNDYYVSSTERLKKVASQMEDEQKILQKNIKGQRDVNNFNPFSMWSNPNANNSTNDIQGMASLGRAAEK